MAHRAADTSLLRDRSRDLEDCGGPWFVPNHCLGSDPNHHLSSTPDLKDSGAIVHASNGSRPAKSRCIFVTDLVT
jgi:hypothetical protein